jgi:hypothetical protein
MIPTVGSRETRIALHEIRFRDINERLARFSAASR